MLGFLRLPQVKPALLLAFCLPFAAQAGPDEDMAQQLLFKALENQYRGRYQATVELIEESFASGRDSLAGQVEFADDLGERRISLAGSGKSFEYKCLNHGKEQWVTDGTSQRIRPGGERQRGRQRAQIDQPPHRRGLRVPGLADKRGSERHAGDEPE